MGATARGACHSRNSFAIRDRNDDASAQAGEHVSVARDSQFSEEPGG